jgi:hypothetical protein
LSSVKLDAPDQGAKDLAAGPPLDGRQPTAHFGDEVPQPPDEHPQVARLSRVVGESLPLIF